MSKGLIDMFLDSIFDADWVGRHGEKLTERELKLVKLFGRKGQVLRNIYVPKGDGETSEIDVVYITQKGIFVIESKNYSGWIFGDEKSFNWTVMLPNKEKNKFYNPIKQNQTHIKWLSKFLDSDIPLFSIVVFSERCELKKVTVDSPDVLVIKRDSLYAAIRKIWDAADDKLDAEAVKDLYKKLEVLTHVDEKVKAEHVESINTKYKKPEKTSEKVQEKVTKKTPEKIPVVNEEQEELVCPRCGGKLVLRKASRGENAGNSFYGCSNFPKCRYIKNI